MPPPCEAGSRRTRSARSGPRRRRATPRRRHAPPSREAGVEPPAARASCAAGAANASAAPSRAVHAARRGVDTTSRKPAGTSAAAKAVSGSASSATTARPASSVGARHPARLPSRANSISRAGTSFMAGLPVRAAPFRGRRGPIVMGERGLHGAVGLEDRDPGRTRAAWRAIAASAKAQAVRPILTGAVAVRDSPVATTRRWRRAARSTRHRRPEIEDGCFDGVDRRERTRGPVARTLRRPAWPTPERHAPMTGPWRRRPGESSAPFESGAGSAVRPFTTPVPVAIRRRAGDSEGA